VTRYTLIIEGTCQGKFGPRAVKSTCMSKGIILCFESAVYGNT